jgi:hypothetical protein
MRHRIERMDLEVHPGGRGMANCSWTREGKVTGGHLSGDDPPFVHIDEKVLPKDIVDELWREAEALDEAVLGLDVINEAGWKGHNELTITFDDGKQMRYCWPFGKADPDPRLKRLLDLLYEHHIGGW